MLTLTLILTLKHNPNPNPTLTLTLTLTLKPDPNPNPNPNPNPGRDMRHKTFFYPGNAFNGDGGGYPGNPPSIPSLSITQDRGIT